MLLLYVYIRQKSKCGQTKLDLDRFWDLAQNLSKQSLIRVRMERHARSNLVKLLFAEDESVVSSTICEDPAEQNQTQ